jgi:hypothetical protein
VKIAEDFATALLTELISLDYLVDSIADCWKWDFVEALEIEVVVDLGFEEESETVVETEPFV